MSFADIGIASMVGAATYLAYGYASQIPVLPPAIFVAVVAGGLAFVAIQT